MARPGFLDFLFPEDAPPPQTGPPDSGRPQRSALLAPSGQPAVNRAPPTQGALLRLPSQRGTGGRSLEGLPGSRPRRQDLLWPVGEVGKR